MSWSTMRKQDHGVSGMEWSEHRPERNGAKWRRTRWAVTWNYHFFGPQNPSFFLLLFLLRENVYWFFKLRLSMVFKIGP